MNKFLTLLFIFTLSACDSPMNNRISTSYGIQNKAQKISFKEYPLTVETQWLVGPSGNITINNTLMVILKDSQGHLINLPDDLSLAFYSTMPSMGHPMEDAGYFEQINDGIYINKNIKYNMPGDWKNELWIMDTQFNIKDKIEWDEFF